MSWLTSPDSDWDSDDPAAYSHEPRSRGRLIFLLVAGWLLVSVFVLVALLTFGGGGAKKAVGQPAPSTTTSHPAQSPTLSVPDGWVQEASDDQTDCAAHSYGEVQRFFGTVPCSSVHRVLATTNQAGRNVVVASYVIGFKSATEAQKFNVLVTANGTGNISDLLREGVTYSGAPRALPPAAFASDQAGDRVMVAEAGYVTGNSNPSDPTLVAVAQQAIKQP